MLRLSGETKDEHCDELEIFESHLGPLGLAQLMKCSIDFTTARNDAIEFCGAAASLPQACLPSAATLFQDQHNGDRKLLALSGNLLTIALFDRSITIQILFL